MVPNAESTVVVLQRKNRLVTLQYILYHYGTSKYVGWVTIVPSQDWQLVHPDWMSSTSTDPCASVHYSQLIIFIKLIELTLFAHK